jgi:hypothetical protein
MMAVSALPELALVMLATLALAIYGLALSGHFPAAHRLQAFRAGAGLLLLRASIVAAVVLGSATLGLGLAGLAWTHVVIAAGAMLLVAPLLLPRFSDAVVDGPAGLLAPLAVAGLATLGLAWRVLG